jgi:acyl-CoA reductase-like NAD-dependent aldehyde dehydrogenase
VRVYILITYIALHNAWGPIMAALFAGNAIVLKCSEHVIWSTSWFVGAIRECLRACGYSEELVQVGVGWSTVANKL